MNGDVNYVIAVTQVGCGQSSITQPPCFELGFDKEAFLASHQLSDGTDLMKNGTI